MATNQKYKEGRYLTMAVAEGTKSGDIVVVGSITGVAMTDRDSAGNATVDTGTDHGVYNLEVKGIDANGDSAVAIGDKITYTAADDPPLNKKADGALIGYALATIAAGGTDTIAVKKA